MKRWHKSFAVLAVCLLSFGSIVYLGIQHSEKAAYADGTFTPMDLGTTFTPVGISDSGIVAGNINGGSVTYAGIWQSGSFTPLSAPSGSTSNRASGISSTGEVVGDARYSTQYGIQDHTVKWNSNGSATDLGGPPSSSSCNTNTGSTQPYAVNDLGDIAGVCSDSGYYAGYWPGGAPNSFTQLPNINNLYSGSGGASITAGINHSDHIVGYSVVPDSSEPYGTASHATIWENGNATDINPSSPGSSWANAINDNDLAVGGFINYGYGFHAYVWDLANNSTYDLTTISGYPGMANAVNSSGVVVGDINYSTPNNHAFMWKAGSGLIDLNSLLPANSGWTLQTADGINSSGQIIGTGILNNQSHAFLLNPSTSSSYRLSLAPASQTAPIGGGQGLVTATLLDGATGAPASNVKLSFRIEAGPNAGMSGTCFPSSCTTDANGQVDWGYLGTAIGVDTVQVWMDTNGNGVPDTGEPQATASMQWVAANLTIHTVVSDWPSWVDPTNLGLVALKITVTNADGTPAKGATVTVSNTQAKFKTNSTGTLTLAERVGVTIDPNVTVQATLGTTSASTTTELFSVSGVTECHLPGAPSKLNALSSLIDYFIPEGPISLLVDKVQKLINWLGGVNTATDLFPDKETTFARAYKYTGSFKSPIYQLQVQIDNNKTGAVIKSFPDTFSRQYALVQPLFAGDGSPLQQIGRSLVCTGPFSVTPA